MSGRLSLLIMAAGLVVSLSQAAPVQPAQSLAFFVATNGNDSWSGRQPEAGRAKNDGPFATVPRALRAVREWKQTASSRSSSIPTIYVKGGLYALSQSLIITPDDSGLIVTAYKSDKPILSGGQRIEGWKELNIRGKLLWSAEVPEVRGGKWTFRELWINGKRAIRARHPNKGYLGVAKLPDKSPEWTQGNRRFVFQAGDLKNSETISNAEVVVMTRWVESRLPILSLDETQSLLTFSKRSVFELAPGDPYYVEGALDFLDQPGEWCLDSAGTVFYMPRPGEKVSRMNAIAPVLSQIVRLEGKPEQGKFVEHLSLKGLTFSHAEWQFPAAQKSGTTPANLEAGGFSQAAIGVTGAVWGEGVRGCLFYNCAFANLGNYGLELARGCQSNRISRCEFFDLGAGGIKIGETAIRGTASEQSGNNEISDCQIHDGGKMFQSSIGVWIGQSSGNRIAHNLIHDFYYTGISIGWTWGYGSALASNNVVEYNHVHHIGIQSDGDGPVLSDMAGIYTLGRQPGTRIVNNLWHDIAAIRYGGWGIYFDEGSSGILAESNVVYRTTHGGFHQHYGETNKVFNNIFAFGRDQQLQRSRVEPHVSFTFETNIVYFDSGNLLGSEWGDDHFQMNWNVYFDVRTAGKGDSLRLGKATLEQWRARGHDQNSVIGNPRFAAPDKNTFKLQPDSPALKLGFCPIDLGQVGPRTGIVLP